MSKKGLGNPLTAINFSTEYYAFLFCRQKDNEVPLFIANKILSDI